jgi:hypothetical protein
MPTSDNGGSHRVFAGDQCLARGSILDVALAARRAVHAGESRTIVVLDAVTSHVVDLDLRGTDDEIAARLAHAAAPVEPANGSPGEAPAPGPGRPRLGVVSREVSLLPRHWDWLKTQRGGASAALRRLVDEARRSSGPHDRRAAAQESVDRFLSVTSGDRPHYEDALRAFYAGRDDELRQLVAGWPADIRDHLHTLVKNCRECEPR